MYSGCDTPDQASQLQDNSQLCDSDGENQEDLCVGLDWELPQVHDVSLF